MHELELRCRSWLASAAWGQHPTGQNCNVGYILGFERDAITSGSPAEEEAELDEVWRPPRELGRPPPGGGPGPPSPPKSKEGRPDVLAPRADCALLSAAASSCLHSLVRTITCSGVIEAIMSKVTCC